MVSHALGAIVAQAHDFPQGINLVVRRWFDDTRHLTMEERWASAWCYCTLLVTEYNNTAPAEKNVAHIPESIAGNVCNILCSMHIE